MNTRARRSRLGAVVLGAIFAFAATARSVGAANRIVNGLDTQDYPSTGALLYGGGNVIDGNNAGVQCSGTLIGCRTFLTAAHCVFHDTTPSHYQVYLQNAGILAVSQVTFHPNYAPTSSGNDIAIVKLAAPVTGVAPTAFNGTHDLATLGVGLPGTIVGFGETTGSANDYGIKRVGDVVTADCNLAATGGEGNDALVCFDYTAPAGPPGSNSDTCYGDSGGPLFVDFAGVTEVVAATTSGSSASCQPPDHSWDVSVFHNAAWVASQLGSDGTTACGGLATVGDPGVLVQQDKGSLGVAVPDAAFTVTLPSDQALLRFAFNGTDNNSFNANYFVKQGSTATTSDYDCKADGTGVFGACEFSSPAAGPWSVLVHRQSGSGQYQVTATMFASTCGNGVAEAGEQCDGSDLGVCPVGPCVACACPAPQCGNNVVEAGEICDGTSDAACPGLCAGDCTCPPTCVGGDLDTLSLVSGKNRFAWKARLRDPDAAWASLDPRGGELRLQVTDAAAVVDVAIPAADAGWTKADPVRRRYAWRGDGSIDGLTRARLVYRNATAPFWILSLRGQAVPGAAAIDPAHVLDYQFTFDAICTGETK